MNTLRKHLSDMRKAANPKRCHTEGCQRVAKNEYSGRLCIGTRPRVYVVTAHRLCDQHAAMFELVFGQGETVKGRKR